MLLQWELEKGFHQIHFLLRSIEIGGLLICLPLLVGTLVGILRIKPHINLLFVIIPSFIHLIVFYIPARFVLLYYSVIATTIVDPQNDLLIIVSSAICIFSINYMCICMFTMFVERCLATRFVQDYEYCKRTHIGYLSLLIFPLSAILSFAVFTESLSWMVLGVIDVFAGGIGAMGIILLCKRNHKKYHLLMESPLDYCKYTLSLRYQLNENILTTQLVRNIIMLTGLCPVINITFYIMMNMDFAYSSLARDAFYACISLETVVMLIVGGLTSPVIREMAATQPGIKYFARKTAPEAVSETDRYFGNLNEQWNQGLPKKKSSAPV